MLLWGMDDFNRRQNEQQNGKKPKHDIQGGSSADGEKISSVTQLAAMMNGK